jgi:glucose-1-phosphate adenylyltransferase
VIETVLAIVLAGGHGTRLEALSAHGAKPALPFAGSLRVIDFALGNCLNSGVRRVAVLTQYKSQGLIRYLTRGYVERAAARGMLVDVVPAQQKTGESWYRGTADAVHQNLDLVDESRARHVLVLAGDHVYKMDYRRMLEEHHRCGAVMTVACLQVPRDQARAFGVMSVDDGGRVCAFAEKPAAPTPVPGSDDMSLVSMGIYVFDARALAQALRHDAADPASRHDFGYDLLPRLLRSHRVFAHRYTDSCVRARGAPAYWRDIGTLDAYWQANVDLTAAHPALDLHDPAWPIEGVPQPLLPAHFQGLDGAGRGCRVSDSLVAPACMLEPAQVRGSVLCPRVQVGRGSVVEDSLLLPGAVIGRDATVRRAIVDAGCIVPEGMEIGVDPARDRARLHVTSAGVTLVTAQMLDPDRRAPPPTSVW